MIVPVYNVKDYLDRCIFSLLRQTYTDFELIIVDDGSTDGSELIVNKYRDERIRVFHKDNGGLSDARNYGIRKARGKYITFVDSDDYVNTSYLQTLVKLIESDDNVDIAMIPVKAVYNGDVNEDAPKDISIDIFSPEEIIEKMLLRNEYSHCGVGKLYRKEIWEGHEFPIGRLYEDYLTSYYIFSRARKVACCNVKLYYYYQRNNSIMHYEVTKNVLGLLDVADEVSAFLLENYKSLEIAILDLKASSYMKILQRILNQGSDLYISDQDRIVSFIREKGLKLVFSNKTPFKDKIKVISLLIGKKFFMKIYNLSSVYNV